MAEITLTIEGMSCQHCVLSVKKAVDKIDGVISSDVAVGSAKIAYNELKTGRQELIKAVQEAGYRVVNT